MTSTRTSTPELAGVTPAYIPWKSLVGYLAALKNTTIPHTLDNTVRPSAMAGGLWRQLLSAMHFLGFVNAGKITQESFKKVVKAYGTQDWKKTVVECILPSYAKIIGDLAIETATSGQLESRFKEHGKVDGQMLEKCVRFYLHALKEAGVKYSDYLVIRREKSTAKKIGGNGKRQKKKDRTAKEDVKPNQHSGADPSLPREEREDVPGPGLIEQRLFFKGKPPGLIRVPADLNEQDCKVIELTLAVFRAYASQGGD